MISFKPSRRELLAGVGGMVVAGAVATTAGLTFWKTSRHRLETVQPPRAAVSADDGWIITAEERRMALDGGPVVSSDILDIRDAVDLPGGDFSSLSVANLSECVMACEKDERCQAFTYARAAHHNEQKRRMCWLKTRDTQPPVTNAAAYVSGRRGRW